MARVKIVENFANNLKKIARRGYPDLATSIHTKPEKGRTNLCVEYLVSKILRK